MDNPSKRPITDSERQELAAKLDQDLDDFIDSLEKRQYTEGWPEDRWQEEMEKHPFFMKQAPQPGDKLDPLMEGLQQLKYDPKENTAEELATAYKEDGNFNFKHKNYRLAIIAYTEAIKQKCGNSDVESTLYNNRSAANYFLKNYRSSLRDCEYALKFQPDYEKVISRAANCCFHVNQFEKAIEYCEKILEKQPENKEALKLRQTCINAAKSKERDERRRQQAATKKQKYEEKLLQEIAKRGINVEGGKDALKLEYLEPQFPELMNDKVFLDQSGKLVWPVVFLYPEYKIMDFLQQFREDEIFLDHLHQVLENLPEWDKNKEYRPQNINIYFENHRKSKIVSVDVKKTLAEVLTLPQYQVRGGTPSFILCVKDSPAEKRFLEQY